MSGSTSNLDQITPGAAGAAVLVNQLMSAMSPNALYGVRLSAVSGLTWAWYGGVTNVSGAPTVIANGTRVLAASTTTYVYVDGSGTVQFSTSIPTGWPGPLTGAYLGFFALYQIVTGGSTITSWVDYRLGSVVAGTAGPAGAAGATWRTGSGVPSNALGVNGDYYIDIATGNVYGKASSVYTFVMNIIGPAWTPTIGSVVYASTVTVDTSLASIFDLTLTGNVVLGFSNGVDGKATRLRIRQDATGSRLLSFAAGVRLGTDLTSVVLSTTPSKLDRIAVEYNGTNSTFDVVSFVRGF